MKNDYCATECGPGCVFTTEFMDQLKVSLTNAAFTLRDVTAVMNELHLAFCDNFSVSANDFSSLVKDLENLKYKGEHSEKPDNPNFVRFQNNFNRRVRR